MAETDFLSFLVDETFKLHKENKYALCNLEQKLKDYKLDFIKGEFIPQIQSLRFNTPFGTLDFPVNWSVFSQHSSASTDALVTYDNDDDHLLKTLEFGLKKKFNKLLMTQADGFCYLIVLTAGDERHLHDLLNNQEWIKVA